MIPHPGPRRTNRSGQPKEFHAMSTETQESIKMTVPLKKAREVLEKILMVLVAILLVVMSGIVFTNVIFRYFLSMGIFWYEELSRFLFIWIVFLGAVIAYMKGDHLSLDVILVYLKPKTRKSMVVFADLLVIASLVVMTQGAYLMAMDSLESGWIASTIPIPYGYVYMVGPLSSVLMLFQAIIKTIDDIHVLVATLKGVN
jgi:TRAP-type C4-dicarboxylate transport system permease small subunit